MPNWTKHRQEQRNDGRPARIAALYILVKNGLLPDLPKTEIAKRLGISRWTLDRDLDSVKEMDGIINEMIEMIKGE